MAPGCSSLGNTRILRYSRTLILPCMNGWIAHMNVSVVPGFALTTWVNEAPGLLPVNQESPLSPRLLPILSQPGLPALAGFLLGGLFGPVTPCQAAITPQIPP